MILDPNEAKHMNNSNTSSSTPAITPEDEQTHIINEEFQVKTTKHKNDKGLDVFHHVLLKNGTEVTKSSSLYIDPNEIYESYLREETHKKQLDESKKEYDQNPPEERKKYWTEYAQKIAVYGERFSDSSVIDVAQIRKEEPEISLYLDSMVRSVAELLLITYQEALDIHFKLDEESKFSVKYFNVPGNNLSDKELTEKIWNLFYDALGTFLSSLSDTLAIDAEKKSVLNESEQTKALSSSAENIRKSASHIMVAWDICKPYIGEGFPNLKHSSEIKELDISHSELGKYIGCLDYGRLSETLMLLSEKIWRDGQADAARGRKKLANELHSASLALYEAAKSIKPIR